MKPITPSQMLNIIAVFTDALEEAHPEISRELTVAWMYDKDAPDYNGWSTTFNYLLTYMPTPGE